MSTASFQNLTWFKIILNGLQAYFSTLRSAGEEASLRRTKYRQTYAELSVLSDRDLNDIGIDRSDIRRLATEESMKATGAGR
ncbi:MAG: DUF1127 domain-containing protein [Sulfitobacter sp.]